MRNESGMEILKYMFLQSSVLEAEDKKDKNAGMVFPSWSFLGRRRRIVEGMFKKVTLTVITIAMPLLAKPSKQ